jgi:flagellar basal-body rod protein FlgB
MIDLDVTGAVAVRALDGLYVRQLAVAHNIANANSPAFAPLRVNFEAALQQAFTATRAGAPAATVAAAPIAVSTDTTGAVRVDMEVSASAENAMQYSLLLAMLDRRLQLLSLAVREGRSA